MDEEKGREFRTIRGYQNVKKVELSASMEDYLEMIARQCMENGMVRIGDLSASLHVKPSSASKMVARLKETGFAFIDPNGNLYLSAAGKKTAEYLLYRHETIERFLTLIGSENALKETELIEHFLSPETVRAIEKLLPNL